MVFLRVWLRFTLWHALLMIQYGSPPLGGGVMVVDCEYLFFYFLHRFFFFDNFSHSTWIYWDRARIYVHARNVCCYEWMKSEESSLAEMKRKKTVSLSKNVDTQHTIHFWTHQAKSPFSAHFTATTDDENFVQDEAAIQRQASLRIVSRIYSLSASSEQTNDDLLTSILIQQSQNNTNNNNDEMPIVKNNGDSTQSENGMDKSIFSVSRVKKVELSEMPLASDICSTRKWHS